MSMTSATSNQHPAPTHHCHVAECDEGVALFEGVWRHTEWAEVPGSTDGEKIRSIFCWPWRSGSTVAGPGREWSQ